MKDLWVYIILALGAILVVWVSWSLFITMMPPIKVHLV